MHVTNSVFKTAGLTHRFIIITLISVLNLALSIKQLAAVFAVCWIYRACLHSLSQFVRLWTFSFEAISITTIPFNNRHSPGVG